MILIIVGLSSPEFKLVEKLTMDKLKSSVPMKQETNVFHHFIEKQSYEKLNFILKNLYKFYVVNSKLYRTYFYILTPKNIIYGL